MKSMEKGRILFIDSAFHKKTKSNVFLREYLREYYILDEVYDGEWKNCDLEKYKSVIFFQTLPNEDDFEKIKNNNILFFPMYDQSFDTHFARLYFYRKCKIINFSKTLHKKMEKWGFDTTFVQYFPKPCEVNNFGDEKSMFFWQRIDKINIKTIEKIVGVENIENLYFHKAPDPKFEIIEPSSIWDKKIKYSSWFEKREDLIDLIEKSALYFASRDLEGIGLSFLEAMATGRVVIAPDKPTMNEYIKNGETGFLYKNKKIELKNIRQIQENTLNFIKNGYEKWLIERKNIIDVIERDCSFNISFLQVLFGYFLNLRNRKMIRFKFGKNGYFILFSKRIF